MTIIGLLQSGVLDQEPVPEAIEMVREVLRENIEKMLFVGPVGLEPTTRRL